MESITKRCTRCETEKTLSEFSKQKAGKFGVSSWCKVCSNEYGKDYYSKHIEEKLEASQRWYYANREKHIENNKTQRKLNPEKRRETERKRYWKNPEKSRDKSRNWVLANLDKVKETLRKYRKSHPEKRTEQFQNYRARKKFNGGRVTAKEWKQILEKYDHKCLCCKRKNVKLTMDHVVPLILGGAHTAENIQPLCHSCNSRKGTKAIDYR